MSSQLIAFIILAYFIVLLAISHFTSRKASNAAFFLGNKQSPWYVVAFGMIGASLSGVTFISVPGWVGSSQFSYMQIVLGYLVGYFVIANVLMPLYYRLNLTSIYTYLEQRFGYYAYKTGALFFLLSRIIGASFRLFLVASVLQITIFNNWNIPFFVTVGITIFLIWLYTFRGGIKTIIWTDSLQTFFMLTSVGLSVYFISQALGFDFTEMVSSIKNSELSKTFFFDDWRDKRFFFKEFFSGAFIAIVMTGLDQDMMQKNLSCRNIQEAKKNMYWFSIILVPVNLLFMSLGVLLFIFAERTGISIPSQTDDLFPLIATGGYLSIAIGISFILGLIAAAYSSADSALTALTTSFTVDILNTKHKDEISLRKTRILVHVFVSIILGIVIMVFKAINNENVISAIFRVAGYTYGPLLGLYAFGLFTKYKVKDKLIPLIAILSPVICYFLSLYSKELLNGYQFGFELLILNGLITFVGLYLVRIRKY